MCLAEVARHTVTIKNGRLKLNFFNPGRYNLQTPNGEITVTVTTKFPTKADTVIKVSGTKDDIDIRIPYYIKDYNCRRIETALGYELYINGKIGHYTEKRGEGNVLKYGPLILAPMIYSWETAQSDMNKTSVPEGYVHESLSGDKCFLILDKSDYNGFLSLEHDPLPAWSVFEEGEMAGISGGEAASAHVSVEFSNGEIKDMFFQPLCSSTTNLTLMDIPICFDIKDRH